jgi:hypothetical protein
VLVQLMPAGTEVTVPVPAPVPLRVNANCCTKVAVTLRAWSMVTGHGSVTGQLIPEPPHPLNTEPAAGAAVSVTDVPVL